MAPIGMSYSGRRLYIEKPEDWPDMLATAHNFFELSLKKIRSYRILYSTDMNPSSPRWELHKSAWDGVKADSCVYIEPPPSKKSNPSETSCCEGDDAAYPDDESNFCLPTMQRHSSITIQTLTGKSIKLDVNLGDYVLSVKSLIHDAEGIPPNQQRLVYDGRQLWNPLTLRDYNIEGGAIIHLVLRLRGAKPAIYLLVPGPITGLTVSIALRKEWDFTILYPLTPVTRSHDTTTKASVSWAVSVKKDGTIIEDRTGRECSYLFWEADTGSSLPGTVQPTAPPDTLASFNPANPTIFFDRNKHPSLQLGFGSFEPYLEEVLKSLTLTPAMRTEFLVYWLPSFRRIRDQGRHIRFTFVPQEAFNQAAELTVEGAVPKTVTRVFMLFGGVDTDHPDFYRHRYHTARFMNDINWPSVVGMDLEAMKDETAFRVLEWGGMEVHSLLNC